MIFLRSFKYFFENIFNNMCESVQIVMNYNEIYLFYFNYYYEGCQKGLGFSFFFPKLFRDLPNNIYKKTLKNDYFSK